MKADRKTKHRQPPRKQHQITTWHLQGLSQEENRGRPKNTIVFTSQPNKKLIVTPITELRGESLGIV